MMLIRSVDDRLVPAREAGWRASSGALELRLAGQVPGDPVQAVARALLAVDLDDHSRVLDVDVIGLPAELLTPLSRYAVPPHPSYGRDPVALDLDAAWLWIHVQDGRRAHRHRQPAIVRFSFAGERLAAIRARLPESES